MMQRILAGCCALGLALVASCSFYVGDPEPPSDPPSEPPPSEPPPSEPPPAPPAPLPPAPPSLAVNVPSDAYDPVNHRLLLPGCGDHGLLTLDLSTGERSVLIDDWPWTEAVDFSCTLEAVIDQTGERAFATVQSRYPDSERGQCEAIDLFAIDTETGVVTLLQNIQTQCCDDYCGTRNYLAMQVDDSQQQLLHVVADCGDICSYEISAAQFEPGASQRLHRVPFCPPYESNCSSEDSWQSVRGMRFDPAAPDDRLLLVTWYDMEYRIESLDIATGAITHVVDIASVPGSMWIANISVDIANQHLLLTGLDTTALPHTPWMVVAVDLVTHEQSVLYHGSPGGDGAGLTCSVSTAFDSRARRLLLFETQDFYLQQDCSERVFALDPDTGALTLLSDDLVD